MPKKIPNSAGLHGVPGPEQFEEIDVPRGQARELACPARSRQPAAECDRTSMFAVFASEPRIYLSVFFGRELEMVGARVYGRRDFDGAVGRARLRNRRGTVDHECSTDVGYRRRRSKNSRGFRVR